MQLGKHHAGFLVVYPDGRHTGFLCETPDGRPLVTFSPATATRYVSPEKAEQALTKHATAVKLRPAQVVEYWYEVRLTPEKSAHHHVPAGDRLVDYFPLRRQTESVL